MEEWTRQWVDFNSSWNELCSLTPKRVYHGSETVKSCSWGFRSNFLSNVIWIKKISKVLFACNFLLFGMKFFE